jgi:hypothetical protein
VIRRGFWLLTGAVLGVTGYRRVTRLARMLTVPRGAGSRSFPGTGSVPRPPTLPAPGRRALPGPERAQLSGPARGARSQVARALAAAGFVRDVRDGMAEYWDLHRGELDRSAGSRTLRGQSDRTSSGESQQGRREPRSVR